MADKYPNVTPYLYCGGNPIKYVDPDGKEKHIFLAEVQSYAANNFKDDSGIYFFGHGSNKDYIKNECESTNHFEKELTAEKLANIITTESNQWQKDAANGDVSMIFLYACHAGEGENCLAQQLSILLNDHENFVIGPMGKLQSSFEPTLRDKEKYTNVGNNRPWGVYKNGKLVTTLRGNKCPNTTTVKCKLYFIELLNSIKNLFKHENE